MTGEGQSLWVSLKARTGHFERRMKKGRRSLKKFQRAIPGVNFMLNRFTAALSVAALAAWTRTTLVSVDSQKKFADRIGISIEEMGGLEHAANRTGVKVESLRMGLQRMVRRVAEAARGTGEAKDAIRELGLSARDLNKFSPDKQFRAIADAMEKVGTQGDRVRLAMKLFDSEGVALVNTMRGGSLALDNFTAAAKRMGIAVSKDQAEAVEKANDALTDMKAVLDGKMMAAVGTMAPAFKKMAENFGKWADGLSTEGPMVIDTLQGIAVGIAAIGDAARNASAFAVKGGSYLGEAANEVQGFIGNLTQNPEMIQSYNEGQLEVAQMRAAGRMPGMSGVKAMQDLFAGVKDSLRVHADARAAEAQEAGRQVQRFLLGLEETPTGPRQFPLPSNISGLLNSSAGYTPPQGPTITNPEGNRSYRALVDAEKESLLVLKSIDSKTGLGATR